MATYNYAPLPAIDPSTGQLVSSSEGQVYAPDDTSFSSPLVVTDLSGAPMDRVSVVNGVTQGFRVDDFPEVLWKSGGYVLFLWSPRSVIDVANELLTQAVTAGETASSAADRVSDYIAQGGTGGGGTVPANLTLDQVQDGTNRLALTQALLTKIDGIPSSYLKVGSTSSDAKRGDYAPTAADVGAIPASGGVTGVLYRTVAQGLPSIVTNGLLVVIPVA